MPVGVNVAGIGGLGRGLMRRYLDELSLVLAREALEQLEPYWRPGVRGASERELARRLRDRAEAWLAARGVQA